ncbi:restriction endonuclease [Opitutales bacterium ASA1]|uniref:restriction endonuclease n=1 Tax=Congregicoccus parvus TaxID=3081749 RepID=UPI002B2D3F7E|nr:restriction endonuclease [Opitutales bacterium ASA1]
MPIPTYEDLLRPLLDLATREDVTRRKGTELMSDAFRLSEEERQALLPSGSGRTIANRVGWAMTFLTKAGLIEKLAKFTYRATERGRAFLERHPESIREKDLREVPGYEQAWNAGKKTPAAAVTDETVAAVETSGATPEDLIAQATETLGNSLRADLLEQLHAVDPFRFEQIVLDLLNAMGYGGSREEAARVTKRSNDEGIDGVINEDRLGLDVVYVQAKRWQGLVGRKEIQSFVGALAGKQATKGIFITTSGFTGNAVEYAGLVSQKVVLIDGPRLADLMIEHNIGVSTVRTIALKRLDSDYFDF